MVKTVKVNQQMETSPCCLDTLCCVIKHCPCMFLFALQLRFQYRHLTVNTTVVPEAVWERWVIFMMYILKLDRDFCGSKGFFCRFELQRQARFRFHPVSPAFNVQINQMGIEFQCYHSQADKYRNIRYSLLIFPVMTSLTMLQSHPHHIIPGGDEPPLSRRKMQKSLSTP